MTLKQAFIDSLVELGVNPEPLDLSAFPHSTPDRPIERVIARADRKRAAILGEERRVHEQWLRDPVRLEMAGER